MIGWRVVGTISSCGSSVWSDGDVVCVCLSSIELSVVYCDDLVCGISCSSVEGEVVTVMSVVGDWCRRICAGVR